MEVTHLAEFVQSGESVRRPGSHDFACHPLAGDALDGSQAEANGGTLGHRKFEVRLDRGWGTCAIPKLRPHLDGEFVAALVDVRGRHLNPHPLAFADDAGHLVRLVPLHKQHGQHVFLRMVGLEPRGLDCDLGVVGGMALVETVSGEQLDVLPDFVCDLLADAVGGASGDEPFPGLVNLLAFLLANGNPHQIGLGGRVVRQLLNDSDDLFLINNDAVGFGQNRFQLRMLVRHRNLSVHPTVVQVDVVHRTGPIEGQGRDDVHVLGRPHGAQRVLEALRFNLEHPRGFAAGQQFKGLFRTFPFIGNGVDVPLFLAILLDQPAGLPHHGQCAEA